jgi:phage shock protein C
MQNKRIYRSKKDYVLAGVCGGIAEYFGIDPTMVRLVFVALMFVGGHGLLIYIVMAIIIPKEPGVMDNNGKTREERAGEFIDEVGIKTKKVIARVSEKGKRVEK